LMVGGCRLDDLAREYGTPVMVVAEDALRRRARDYRERLAARWPDSRVLFASKAFPCTAVQRLMVSEGLWIDVADAGHDDGGRTGELRGRRRREDIGAEVPECLPDRCEIASAVIHECDGHKPRNPETPAT
jgi:hypothetical protein